MKKVVSISLGPSEASHSFTVQMLGESIEVEQIGTDSDMGKAARLITQLDGQVAAIGLDSMNRTFHVGDHTYVHQEVDALARLATRTPVVDGSALKKTLERWAIEHVAHRFDGIFRDRLAFIPSGIDRYAMASVLATHTDRLVLGDAMFHWGLPIPLRSLHALDRYARLAMPYLCRSPYKRIYPTGRRQTETRPMFTRYFDQADIIAGGFHYIRRYGPDALRNKIVITNSLSAADLDDMRLRGVRMIITTTPEMNGRSYGTNVLEAIFVALMDKDPRMLTLDDYLEMIVRSKIEPRAIYPQGEPVRLEKFAFVVHPLSVGDLYKHPILKHFWWMPGRMLEWLCAWLPPLYVSTVTGVRSATGTELEGILLGLGATPKEMMRRDPEFVYRKLVQCTKIAERFGAKLMGLGAFTSVVGDAGITVARRSSIGITSGNSYTVASTLEAAKVVARKMGKDPRQSTAMVIGATGSIGNVCARILAKVCPVVQLVAPRPEALIELQRRIESETKARVQIATHADELIGEADLVITTTTSRGARLFDFERVKPGAIICDVARPLDIHEEDAKARPDVLVIESGELTVPGPVDFHADIGLPPKTAYGCLSETMILALEGRYETYTVGRDIDADKVRETYKLGNKHGFKLAHIRTFGRILTDQEIELAKERALERTRRLQMCKTDPAAPTPPSPAPPAEGTQPAAGAMPMA